MRLSGHMHRLPIPIVFCAVLLAPGLASGQTVEYAHLDAVGNIRAVTNQTGQLIERHDYLPFGEEVNPQPGNQPLRFTGKERNTETGFDYFGARYYQARIGRFTTVDPVYTWRDNLVDPQRWNRYAYARNNPLRYVDPDGKDPVTAAVVIGGLTLFYLLNNPTPEGISGAAPGSMGSLPFKSGDIIARELQSTKGVIDVMAQAVIEGKTLHLKDIAIYARAAEALDIGTREVLALRRQLGQEARQLGFERLRMSGVRLSGAKPGKTPDVVLDLTKNR